MPTFTLEKSNGVHSRDSVIGEEEGTSDESLMW